MGEDRVTWMRVRGMRSLADVELDLSGLTVLIGENGSGKSTIIEALELLRQVARPGEFVTDVVQRRHGGLRELLRQDADELGLSVRVRQSDGSHLDYSVVLAFDGLSPAVSSERFAMVFSHRRTDEPLTRVQLERNGSSTTVPAPLGGGLVDGPEVPPRSLAVSAFGLAAPPIYRVLLDALAGIDVHSPFDTRPIWLLSDARPSTAMRLPQMIESTDHLDSMGENLTNCIQRVRSMGDDVWARVIDRARAGLGHDLREVRTVPRQRGEIDTEVWFGSLPKPIPLSALSEGQLAYLAFVVLTELGADASLVALDEPDTHMHPELLVRVVWMLEELATKTPVVVSTHSDRLLDALEDPAASVVLCELDEHRATRLRRPDRVALSKWLADYRGMGQIRAEGYESHVFAPAASSAEAASC